MRPLWTPLALAMAAAAITGACVPAVDHGAAASGGAGGAGGVITGASGGAGGATDAGPSGLQPLAITTREVATRLAKVLWQAAPDADLLTRAGAVKSRDDVRVLALDMLKDPRARAGVAAFYRWWLNLDEVAAQKITLALGGQGVVPDVKKFPEWTPAMSADVARETETFGVSVTLDMNGTFRTLLTAPFTFINQRVATLYGIPGVAGDTFRKVELDPRQRAGLLTQPALLSVAPTLGGKTDPPARGRVVRLQFLCQFVPLLMIDPPVTGTPTAPGTSTRQGFEMLTSHSPCTACHTGYELNNLGFAFEGLDPLGRARTVDDNGKPVDLGGLQVRDAAGASVPFEGPVQLASLLADHADAQRCFSSQWFRFAAGETTYRYQDDLDGIQTAFQASGLDLRALIAAAVSSPFFLADASSGPADAGSDHDAGTSHTDGPANLPEGCAMAADIFGSRGCATLCHNPTIAPSVGGFDMKTPGWEQRLVGAGPPSTAPDTSACKNKGLNYLNRTQPATGLFLK